MPKKTSTPYIPVEQSGLPLPFILPLSLSLDNDPSLPVLLISVHHGPQILKAQLPPLFPSIATGIPNPNLLEIVGDEAVIVAKDSQEMWV